MRSAALYDHHHWVSRVNLFFVLNVEFLGLVTLTQRTFSLFIGTSRAPLWLFALSEATQAHAANFIYGRRLVIVNHFMCSLWLPTNLSSVHWGRSTAKTLPKLHANWSISSLLIQQSVVTDFGEFVEIYKLQNITTHIATSTRAAKSGCSSKKKLALLRISLNTRFITIFPIATVTWPFLVSPTAVPNVNGCHELRSLRMP